VLVPADIDPIELAESIRSTVEHRYKEASRAVTAGAPAAGITTPDSPALTVRVGISRRQVRDFQVHLELAAQATRQAALNGRNCVEVLQ